MREPLLARILAGLALLLTGTSRLTRFPSEYTASETLLQRIAGIGVLGYGTAAALSLPLRRGWTLPAAMARTAAGTLTGILAAFAGVRAVGIYLPAGGWRRPGREPEEWNPRWIRMRRYLTVAALIAAALLAMFLVAEALQLPITQDPVAWLRRDNLGAALLGVGLLTVDVLLPVPSSGVMILHGALFGVGLGTALSMLGGLGATLVGFAIGRAGGPLLARYVTPAEQERADRLLRRWGALAIVATRPVPIIAETVAILAGTSSMGWGRAALAALVGLVPPALLYSLAGAAALSWVGSTAVFLGVLLLSAATWLLARRHSGRPR